MNTLSMDGLWSLMTEYTFSPDNTCLNEELLCILCKKIMIDGHRSVICGCRYCYKCIRDYLGDGEKFCPGNSNKCNEEYLILTTDVVRDRRINGLIAKMKVKCPHKSCDVTMELIEMEDHLRLCSTQVSGCPFKLIGCENEEQEKESIVTHVTNETLMHAELLVEWIQNVRNDIDAMKVSHEENRLQAREDSMLKDRKIAALEEEVDRLRNVIEAATSVESVVMVASESLPPVASDSHDEFVWRIDDWSKKRGGPSVYSDHFYRYGYKLCLSLFLYGDGVGLNCVLMKGDKDHELLWPMNKTVTLSILDQVSMAPHETLSFHYDNYANKAAFERPTSDRANFIGANPFVLYSSIKDRATVVVNDSIIVSCIVTDRR